MFAITTQLLGTIAAIGLAVSGLSNSGFGPGACNVADDDSSIELDISGSSRLHIEGRALRTAGNARVGVIVEVNGQECSRASHSEKFEVSAACVVDVKGGPHTISLVSYSANSSKPRYALCVSAQFKGHATPG